jgi:phage N-6-adenine-methyltransferase
MNDSRTTPAELFAVLDVLYGPFELDAAATEQNTLTERFCRDGLSEPWAPRTWCNPPYSRGQLDLWTNKAFIEAGRGMSSALLIPADTSTRWWFELIPEVDAIVFLTERVAFGGGVEDGKTHAKFGSAVMLYGPAYRDREKIQWLDWRSLVPKKPRKGR